MSAMSKDRGSVFFWFGPFWPFKGMILRQTKGFIKKVRLYEIPFEILDSYRLYRLNFSKAPKPLLLHPRDALEVGFSKPPMTSYNRRCLIFELPCFLYLPGVQQIVWFCELWSICLVKPCSLIYRNYLFVCLGC